MDGIDAITQPLKIKKIVNMVAGGERMIYWRLTARENLWYYGQLYNIDNRQLSRRIPLLLKLVGLEGRENVPVETFSKGMKQRLQIARGLINDPQYLFMDEPTIGLDAVVAKELREHVRHLAKKEDKGILLTSHYLGEIEELCDYLYVMSKGVLIRQGTSRDLIKEVFDRRIFKLRCCEAYDNFSQALKERFPSAEIISGEDETKVSVICSENIAPELAYLCAQKGFLLREIHEEHPSLEDTILQLAKDTNDRGASE